MNYYELRSLETGELVVRGNARECAQFLGCNNMDTFYHIANHARRGLSKKYTAIIKKGGEVDYPVLGEKDPMYQKEESRK